MALERFITADLTDRKAPEEDQFQPEQLLEQAWGLTVDEPVRAVIRFSPAAAPYIREREWKKGQEIVLEAEGSLLLKFTASGRRDIKSWVLSFGRDACLLEPADLKDEIRKDLHQMNESYKSEAETG